MDKKKDKDEKLVCDKYVIQHKDSGIEMILKSCKTSLPKIINLMRKYNKNEMIPVNICNFYQDKKTVFGRNQELPSNLNGIYFFGEIRKNNVVFTFKEANQTKDYLLGFYLASTQRP